jgi:hypothetical protein
MTVAKLDKVHRAKNNSPVVVSDETVIGEDSNEPSKRTGLCALKSIEEIKIIAIPKGTTQKIQNAMIAQCEQMRNRYSVFDPKKFSDLVEIRKQRSIYNSKFAALYYP